MAISSPYIMLVKELKLFGFLVSVSLPASVRLCLCVRACVCACVLWLFLDFPLIFQKLFFSGFFLKKKSLRTLKKYNPSAKKCPRVKHGWIREWKLAYSLRLNNTGHASSVGVGAWNIKLSWKKKKPSEDAGGGVSDSKTKSGKTKLISGYV